MIIYIFQGQDLTHVGIDNYLVNIGTGKGNCKVLRVEYNTLVCQPPKLEPGVNQSLGKGAGEPGVYVSVNSDQLLNEKSVSVVVVVIWINHYYQC